MSYRPGDKVFAKIKGFSNWPARVNPLPPEVQIPKGKLPVFFYGTYQVSFVPVKNIVPYEKFKEKLGKPKSSPQFMTAMQEIESNPGIYMLGEDPRAERFLLQFYSFQPESTSTTRRNHSSTKTSERSRSSKIPPPDSPGSLSPLSEPDDSQREVISPPRSRGRSKPVGQQQSATTTIPESKSEALSETSSDVSSAPSKLESTEVNPTSDDDDDDTTETLTKHSSVDVSTQGDPLSDVDEGSPEPDRTQLPPITETEALQEATPLDSHEARKLQRKLEKKAQKKAAKKAAKREAKRLAKEAERAERRARREARREMKRLHRLQKQQRMQEQSDCHAIELVMEGDSFQSKDSWNLNAEQLNPSHPYMTEEAQVISMPYEELIAAELECNDMLSPNLDRPTSPLRLEDYLQPEVPNDSGADDSLQDTTIMMKEETLPSPTILSDSQQASVISPVLTGTKRSLQQSNGEESPLESPDSEPEQVLQPRKRVKTDSKRLATSLSSPLNDDSNHTETPEKAVPVAVKPERSKPTSPSESKSKRDRTSSEKSRKAVKSRKTPIARRRRIIDSSSSSEDEHKPSPALDSEPAGTSPESPSSEQQHPKEVEPPSSPKPSSKPEMTSQKPPSFETSKKSQRVEDVGSRRQSKATESRLSSDEKKKHKTPEDGQSHASPGPTDVVTQLCQHCRELKASLVRGHENFALAVQHLTELASMQIRLPQLAQAWDLMDCIKKCRRYKLSEEVRNAAQKTFSAFQAIKSSATKEELTQTQALLASHQTRPTVPGGNNAPDTGSKQPRPSNDCQSTTHMDLTKTTPDAVVPSEPSPSAPATVGTTTTTVQSTAHTSPTVSKAEPENLTADLEAKMVDMLSRIRATEERMAAAAAASQLHPKNLGKPLHSMVPTTFPHPELGSPSSGLTYGGAGHAIRAKAVAAAAAHMHDEEDEESVMSRIEQVAAFEVSKVTSGITDSTTTTSHVSQSPPPPPPPLPSTSIRVSTGMLNSTPPSVAAPVTVSNRTSPPSVDLDLDSRIERLITGPKSNLTNSPATVAPAHTANSRFTETSSRQLSATSTPPPSVDRNNGHPTIPAPLLAVADKIAAARALNPSPRKRDPLRKSPRSSLIQTDSSAKLLQAEQSASSQDDELYDLLGV